MTIHVGPMWEGRNETQDYSYFQVGAKDPQVTQQHAEQAVAGAEERQSRILIDKKPA